MEGLKSHPVDDARPHRRLDERVRHGDDHGGQVECPPAGTQGNVSKNTHRDIFLPHPVITGWRFEANDYRALTARDNGVVGHAQDSRRRVEHAG